MKVELDGDLVRMTAESEEDHAAMHRIRVLGIETMTMRGSAEKAFGPGLSGPLEIKLISRPEASVAA